MTLRTKKRSDANSAGVSVPKRKRRMRVVGKILCIFVILLAIIAGFFCVSPLPSSWLLRAAFQTPQLAQLPDYGQMEESVYVEQNLSYPSQHLRNTLDLYLPKQAGDDTPVILWAHGGAYVGGDKTDVEYYATALAAQGYAVVSMNYSLAPEEKYPTPLVQVADVCRWLASVQEEYRFDMGRLVLAGDSAGAHLMVQFALVQTSPQYADLCGQRASLDPESIRGILLYCGPYDAAKIGSVGGLAGFMIRRAAWAYYGSWDWDTRYEEQISVIEHVTEKFPPAFITDGNTGSFQAHGEKLEAMLKSKNVQIDTYFMPVDEEKTSHEYQFIMNTPAGQECYARTLAFLKKLF